MKIIHHMLTSATWRLSPNYDERPNANDISLVVIHCISLPPGEFGNNFIDNLFFNNLDPAQHPYFNAIHQLKVSAHLLVKRNGETLQYVPFDKRAWHAGQSVYQGREKCNDFSIGIELEGTEYVDYTDVQYQQLASILQSLVKVYPKLSFKRITGHSDIAPARKTDPGASFDWNRLFQLLRSS